MFQIFAEIGYYANIDIKDATVKIKDGSGSPKVLTLKIGEGNVSWTETHNRTYVKDRGQLDTVRNADEEPLDLKLSATWEYITATGSSGNSPRDAMLGEGTCADWTSSDADACAPYCVDIELHIVPPCTGLTHHYTFADFRVESIEFDLRGGTISFNGKCNIIAPTLAVGG